MTHQQQCEDLESCKFLRARQTACEIVNYCKNGTKPAKYDAAFLVEQAEEMLQKRDTEYNKLMQQFGDNDIYKLADSTLEERINWGRIIALLAFGVKINCYSVPWYTYVLLKINSI
jgi:hydroxylamine reductase (hybrid-cluster protein)